MNIAILQYSNIQAPILVAEHVEGVLEGRVGGFEGLRYLYSCKSRCHTGPIKRYSFSWIAFLTQSI